MTKTIRFLNVPEDLKNLLTKKENEDKVKTSRMLFSKDNNFLEPSTILEINKKIESFMDFSIYLNDNISKINNYKNLNYSINTANFGNITFNWNISRIYKK